MDKQKCGDFSAGYNALTCTECCHGDLCNAGGCGEKGFDPALGPLCYTCHLQIGTRSCNKIQQCGRDKDCSIHPVTRLGASNNLFETKCTERNICVTSNRIGSSAIVGRKRSTCSICCNSTLCNDYDPRLCVPTTTTKSITTVLATHEVCEDAPNVPCHERACNGSPKEYMEKNCRKTCKFCAVKTTPVATSTTTAISTASPSTVTSTSLRTSTMSISRSGMTGHTHDPFCLDNAVGCDQYVHFCVLDEYKTWTKTNCRRTCGYC
ncbi:uncharacterized protein LOC123549217 isoform X1 [Mercenaria mercenaria]|uniref:uncharacterized protein LOC123549217 isoform X1 n=1 Tax=Mercenaria mercenaria TaxID=6596 RepID=UPI00234ED00A|nr:uncharacterized protein LOC123549217 isoform X1 [Mercenaria mercenaria]